MSGPNNCNDGLTRASTRETVSTFNNFDSDAFRSPSPQTSSTFDDFADDVIRLSTRQSPSSFNNVTNDLAHPAAQSSHRQSEPMGHAKPPDNFDDETEGTGAGPRMTRPVCDSNNELIQSLNTTAPDVTVGWQLQRQNPSISHAVIPPKVTAPRGTVALGVACLAALVALGTAAVTGTYLYSALRDRLNTDPTQSADAASSTTTPTSGVRP